MVADVVPPERHEAAYASVRVANNLGVVCGPPIGSVLLIGRHWPVLFLGVAALALATIAIAGGTCRGRRVQAGGAADARLARR